MNIFRFFIPFLKSSGRNLIHFWHTGLLSSGWGAISGKALLGSHIRIPSIRGLETGTGLRIGEGASLLCEGTPELPCKVILGKNVKIGDRTTVGAGPGQKISIGDNTSTHHHCYLVGDIKIGRYCLLSANIFISSGDHYFSEKPEVYIKDQDAMVLSSTQGQPRQSFPVTIGDDCWLGWGVAVRKGIHIGKGSIVGANSVVTKDIPPYSIAVGSPAKVIRQRIPFQPVKKLESNKTTHYPYLYEGFLHGQSEVVNKEGQVLVPMSSHSMAVLAGGPFQKLRLAVWSEDESKLDIQFMGETKSLVLKNGFNEQEILWEKTQGSGPELKHRFFETMNVFELKSSSSNKVYFKSIEIQ